MRAENIKKTLKKIKKVLDIVNNLCYNISVNKKHGGKNDERIYRSFSNVKNNYF